MTFRGIGDIINKMCALAEPLKRRNERNYVKQ